MEGVSFIQAVRKGMQDNIYDFTKDGKCSSCGNCCSNLLPMSKKEISAIRKYIRQNSIQQCKHLPPVVKASYDMTCPFRDNDKEICTIYPVRPAICRAFICNNEKRAKNNRKLLKQTREIIMVREEFFNET